MKWRGVEQWSWWFALIDRILSIVSLRENKKKEKVECTFLTYKFISFLPKGEGELANFKGSRTFFKQKKIHQWAVNIKWILIGRDVTVVNA